jgi:hypothetical protein
MAKMGLNDEIRAVFEKPDHNNIRPMQNLSKWLVEILDTSFEALYFLEHRILDELDSPPADIHGKGEETIPQVPGDHIALYKSAECKIGRQMLHTPDLQTRQLHGPRQSDPCRDSGLYFSQQSWVANQYSALISDACVVALRKTVEMHVPLAHLQVSGVFELKLEDDMFKQLAFACRNGFYYKRDICPQKIRDMLSEYEIISGPMLQAHNSTFEKMESWRNFTKEHQLRNINEPRDVAK